MYSALAVANAFIEAAKQKRLRKLTPMKLNRLLLFSQISSLKTYDIALFDDFFCNWETGPVIPSIFHKFRHYRNKKIKAYGSTIFEKRGEIVSRTPIIHRKDFRSWGIIDDIIRKYEDYSGNEMARLTRIGEKDGEPITNEELIKL